MFLYVFSSLNKIVLVSILFGFNKLTKIENDDVKINMIDHHVLDIYTVM